MHLPPEKKTIRPTHVGGIAGGSKYVIFLGKTNSFSKIVNGIIFKFAVDQTGGKLYPSTEMAMKAADAGPKTISTLKY